MLDFLHTFNPQPILYSFGPVHIYWYGLFMVLSIVTALLITTKLAKSYDISQDTILDLTFWLIIFGLLGARIYDVLLEYEYFLKNPVDIIKIWQGGLAIHGALIAGLLTLWFYSKKHKLDFWLLAAIITPGLALAQAIGRWGNYFNQELFGGPTNLPWGIPIDLAHRPLEYLPYTYFHPTFLYESIGSLIISFFLLALHLAIIKNRFPKTLHVPRYALCVASYAILYSLLRFLTEFIRIDSTPHLLGLRLPQAVSLGLILAALALIFLTLKKKPGVTLEK